MSIDRDRLEESFLELAAEGGPHGIARAAVHSLLEGQGVPGVDLEALLKELLRRRQVVARHDGRQIALTQEGRRRLDFLRNSMKVTLSLPPSLHRRLALMGYRPEVLTGALLQVLEEWAKVPARELRVA